MKARVVFCRSNPVDPDPRVEKEAAALSDAGWQVQIVAWDRSGSLPQRAFFGQSQVTRLPIRAEYARGLRNLPDLLRWQVGLLDWLLRNRDRYEMIHACDFDTVLPALLCKGLFGKRVVYDIFDFYADHLRATPGALTAAIRSVDRWAIRRADALILADEARWQQIGAAGRTLERKNAAVIYNSPQDVLASLDAAGSPSMDTNLEGETAPDLGRMRGLRGLRIAYIGLLQVERGIFELLEVLQRRPEWSLDLAGFGGDQERILARLAGMPNVRWHGRVPYDQALALSHQADVLLATYDPAIPNHRYASPNKVFEAMMLGKPVIVAAGTNMDQLIAAAGCGLVVTYGEAGELEAALARLESDAELRRRLSAAARQAYETQYSWQVMRGRLLDLYSAVQADLPPAGAFGNRQR